ncbi:hypothetical protein [Dactylosporangium darangshiense]|uniref:Bacterial bifunctional deaminase-reductase C-terminal domain-containing protein n=1 Tax=Dactylosporangium darangshiense TaxID=579108 RepID=A0ABP8DV79_9ACTN
MSKVIVGLSTSLDGVASGTSETDFWDMHNAVDSGNAAGNVGTASTRLTVRRWM